VNDRFFLGIATAASRFGGDRGFSPTGGNPAYIALVKKRKGFGNKRGPTRSWLDKQFRRGFRGYPVATVAFYGPNDELATKIVVSVFLTEGDEPDSLKRWFTEDQTDIRDDPAIGEEILTFFKTHAPRSTVVTDAIIGCPHEEGTDYPQGTSCPRCPYWAGRDRFTHERIQ
jgi:hypothetical protein